MLRLMPLAEVPITRTVDLVDEAATRALGARLAPLLRRGDLVALSGPLGTGKTTLARALIRRLAGDESLEVPSPTFTLVQGYETPALEIWHVDLYRITSPREITELGLDEALERGATLIEWPERAGESLAGERLEIALSEHGAGRRAQLTGHGSWRERLAHV